MKLEENNTEIKIKTKPCFFTVLDLFSSFCILRPKRNHQSHISPDPIVESTVKATSVQPIESFAVSRSPAPISPCMSYSPRTLDHLICSKLSASDRLPSLIFPPLTEDLSQIEAEEDRSLVEKKI